MTSRLLSLPVTKRSRAAIAGLSDGTRRMKGERRVQLARRPQGAALQAARLRELAGQLLVKHRVLIVRSAESLSSLRQPRIAYEGHATTDSTVMQGSLMGP